jgi:hypothetical protein
MTVNRAGLLAEYAHWARLHGEATEEGDSDGANKAHDGVLRVLASITSEGGRTGLLPLLSDGHASVRCWAATHLLTIAPEAAEPVLAQLADRVGAVALDAEMVLRGWNDGTLKIP